jgi:hypothetical protein
VCWQRRRPTAAVEVLDALLALLSGSRLGQRLVAKPVQAAPAIHAPLDGMAHEAQLALAPAVDIAARL